MAPDEVFPEDDEGRVNTDLEPEDALRILLNVDLRDEIGDDE